METPKVECDWCDTVFVADGDTECPNCGEMYREEPTEAQLTSFYDVADSAERSHYAEKELRETGRR